MTTMSAEIFVPPIVAAEAEKVGGTEWMEKAEKWSITNSGEYLLASDFLKQLKGAQKSIAELFAAPVKAAHEAHKAVCAFRDRFLIPMEGAETVIKSKMKSFAVMEEFKRKKEEERIQKEAEARAKAEQEKKVMESLAKGKTEEAATVLDKPVEVPRVQIAPTLPKPSGVTMKKVWYGECVDMMAMLKGIVEGRLPINLVSYKPSALNDLAKLKGVEGTADGIRMYQDSVVSSRAF